MKKIYIALAVLAAAALTSCEREKSFNDLTPLGENDLAFAINGVTTRSGDSVNEVTRGVSIPVTVTDSGESLFLEETIEELNPSPATKGAPAYTVNVGNLYSTMGVYASNGEFGDAVFELVDAGTMYDNKETALGKGWRYHHNYNGNPWPDNNPVDFYLRMPADDSGIVQPETGDAITYSSGQISFDYLSPLSGKKVVEGEVTAIQNDILFGQTTLKKSEHDGFLPYGAPVLMYHALTGVKFRTGNDNSGTTKTIITKVEFTGLAASGHCVITPSTGNVTWTGLGSRDLTFEQEFSNPAYSQTSDNTLDYGTYNAESSKFGKSWYSAAADKNLNDEDGSLTFWFIPQAMTDGVKLKVTFVVKTPDTSTAEGGGVFEHIIDFGKKLPGVTWSAGQLRTYTLVPKDVDVDIFDDMVDNVKSTLRVTNTGNVHEYVRMTFLGNWYDADGNIVVGYKYAGDETDLPEGTDINEMVLPWYGAGYPCTDPDDLSTINLEELNNDNYSGPRVDPYGYFDESFFLAQLGSNSKWVRASGGYYFTEAIGPGIKLNSATQALFQSYTLTDTPDIYVPSPTSQYRVLAQGVHLEMEIAIQAIFAPVDDEGNETSNWKQEWYNATGNPKLKP